jgi:hypothetical protein
MSRRSIGGRIDAHALALLAGDPATVHRPDNVQALAAAARDLASRGLTHRDIGTALRLSSDAVLQLLKQADDQPAVGS